VKSLKLLHSDAERIWTAGLMAVDPEVAVGKFVRRKGNNLLAGKRSFDLDSIRNVWVLGAGKAAASMGRSLENILGEYLTGGFLATKYGHGVALEKLDIMEAGHPLPDANSVFAAQRIVSLAERIVPGDLVFCLFSGGASSLLVSPAPGISLEDKVHCTQALMNSGTSIHDLNAVRKHLSILKGGGLARMIKQATIISVILSDVVGDEVETIASGPTVPDETTFSDCMNTIHRPELLQRIPPTVKKRFEDGMAGRIEETPKDGDSAFAGNEYFIVGNSAMACTASANAARRLGYHSIVLTSGLEGDTGSAAGFHMSILEEILSQNRPIKRPACILSGGETTVKVTGSGKGGRNQEFVLHCVGRLAKLQAPCLVASLGTDGTDGPTDAAGAVADNSTLAKSLKYGSSFLEASVQNNNSYEFFKRLGNLIITGPTRTNVMDLRILLVG